MKVNETELNGVLLIEPQLFVDDRGLFLETYHAERYISSRIDCRFLQDNLSFSKRGVLRGLHYQLGRPQSKLVMAVHGEIYDVAVDIRQGSPTFGRWVAAVLSSRNYRQMFIPEGFAHGFCVASETATVIYKCTDFYAPMEERGLRWDDPRLAIDWPIDTPTLSEKDSMYPTLDTVSGHDLPLYRGSGEGER